MNILICDDDPVFCEQLQTRVRSNLPDAQVKALTSCAGADELNADLIFLDIDLGTTNGMELARALRAADSPALLVFVTADADLVFDAFEVDALGYLVKPLSEERLNTVLSRAREKLLERTAGEEPSLTVKRGGTSTRVRLSELIYAEVYGRIVLLHTTRDDLDYYGTMSELERFAGADFFRTHRSFLIHFAFVERYSATEVVLTKGRALLTKKKYPAFVKAYLAYAKRHAGERL